MISLVALVATLAVPFGPAVAGGAMAAPQCPAAEELAPYWPPVAPLGLLVKGEGGPREFDIGALAFEDVRVLLVTCADVRGRGPEAYALFTLPPLFEGGTLVLLAALHAGDDSLTAIDLAVGDRPEAALDLHDITGDGNPEVAFGVGTGAFTAVAFAVWGWEDERYQLLFRSGGDVGPSFRDLDGDGTMEMVLHQRVAAPDHASSFFWPTAYRWDGRSLRPSIVPQVYEDFISFAEARLRPQAGESPLTHSVLAVSLGHAYQLQGRTVAARGAYDTAWERYQRAGERLHCQAAEAVRAYYASIPWNIARAYGLAAEAVRLRPPFAEFAAGFARTREVSLLENPRVVDQEEDVFRVAVRISAVDLTPDGEVEQQFSGVWRVQVREGACSLLGAEISLEGPP